MSSSNSRLNILKKHLSPLEGDLLDQKQSVISTNETSSFYTTALNKMQQINGSDEPDKVEDASGTDKPDKHVLYVKDSKTGKEVEIPVNLGAVEATDFQKLKLRVYDPGFLNTAVAKSEICFIDGDKGILRYRGYSIEELAEKSNYLEVAYLLINGELPTKEQYELWSDRIMKHTFLHENLTDLLKTFRYDAHPMGMVISTLSALSTFYPYANPALQGNALYEKENMRNKQIFRLLGKLPTIAASAYRHRIGKPYNNPRSDLSYTENFLYMLDRLSENEYKPHPVLVKALDKLFIIHADHELNCSTAAMRHLSSSKVDPYTAMAGAAGALYGPLHGGACEAVLRMLESIGSKEKIPEFIEQVKQKKKKLMGFGHRIYRSYDPRARIARQVADEVFAVLGKEPLIEIATELERIALSDPYFVDRKLYPNVDFYTGLVYKAMGFPTDIFPVLFCIPRASGWLAHWIESLNEPNGKIFRPRQLYIGEEDRPYVPVYKRYDFEFKAKSRQLDSYVSPMSKRRNIKH